MLHVIGKQAAINRLSFANHSFLQEGRMAQENSERRAVLLRRFPEDLHRQLAKEAEASERTVPAEIIYRLRTSLRREPEKAAA
jgi:hypothetical protein